MKLNNPFLIRGYNGSEYFCDRENETMRIISALENERDVTLIAPRRYGKTGLIHNVFAKMPDGYKTIYIDIFSTASLADFTRLFASAVKFSFDVVSSQAETTLREAFEYLKSRDKRVIIAIDEFQQILEYPEKGTEALLRSMIQFLPNVRFIFAGSRHHLMRDMFMMPRHPFYQSTDILGLEAIDCKTYAVFARKFFNAANLPFEDEVFANLYKRYDGVTWYLQMVLNRIWEQGEGLTSTNQIDAAVRHITELRVFEYSDLLASQNDSAQKILRAMAKERCVAEPQSGEFVQKAHIASPSTMRSALQVLIAKDMIYKTPQGYIVYDRFFADWLAA